MSNVAGTIRAAVHNAKAKFSNKKDESMLHAQRMLDHDPDDFVDINIRFIGASGLPKMDVVGSADPFFVATLDDKIKFISSVKSNTLAPVWNERWSVKNVPKHAVLEVSVFDKDEGTPLNDYIGKIKTNIEPGTKDAEIVGPVFKLRRERGTFWLEVESAPAEDSDPKAFPYDFNGPIRYSRHTSPTAGVLTNLNEARLYATWKMYLKGIRRIFGEEQQHWNQNYKAAQTIFQGPSSYPVRQGIKTAHDILYSRTTENGFGVIEGVTDIVSILHSGGASRPNQHQSDHQKALSDRVKPAIYTYVIAIDDSSFRFSETGAAFFVDFASKHALHSKCSEHVWYSGEFHPRPKGGWDKFSDDQKDSDVEWEFVIDNNSGTYAPNKELLPKLKELLEYNFPGFTILALDREDEELKRSVAACREYALGKREVTEDELEPNLSPGEAPLSARIWEFRKSAPKEGGKESNEDKTYPEANE
ncbi:hypothetical protein FRB91_003002 [Serendipita sp. 411]|nr:hypothetical protein FRB91_003002 [Serendipita sp. 411]